MKEKITVNTAALRQILEALVGPGVVLRELQATRRMGGDAHPINILVKEFDAEYRAYTEQENEDETGNKQCK